MYEHIFITFKRREFPIQVGVSVHTNVYEPLSSHLDI